ncbi:MAG TPA: hypothetical protein VFC78_08050 [Tepidisphaeraceae bacterium]|nr:hypothetical protein [Tepidisphaeraceae bacterium]
MRIGLPRRRMLRALIYFVCLVLVLLAVDMIMIQMRRTIHPGFDTTRIIEPRLPDGRIDYLAAIEDHFGQSVTAQNNAAPLVLEALGRAALPHNQPADGITDRLGMPHLAERGDYLVSYEAFRTLHKAEAQDPDGAYRSLQTPWPATPPPLTAAWIAANEKPLAKIEDATKLPRFFMPFNGGPGVLMVVQIPLTYLTPLRYAAVALCTRAMLREQAGDFEGCRRDLLATHRLARLIAQQPSLVECLVAGGIERLACRTERGAAASGKLTAAQARLLAGDLASMPDLPPWAQNVDSFERYNALDLMQECAHVGPVRTVEILNLISDQHMPAQLVRWVPVPYEESMRALNRAYDRLTRAANEPTYARQAAALRLSQDELATFKPRNPVTALLSPNWWLTILFPSLTNCQQSVEAVRMENRLSQVALALAAYKAEHGGYPKRLEALAPAYLAAVPLDLFVDKPLVYAAAAKGYTLYSVGPNMIDDGGKSAKPCDDIVASVP